MSRQPAVIHHVIGADLTRMTGGKSASQKANDWLVIPLAPEYHTGKLGIHQLGVATWESQFGRQVDFLKRVCEQTGVDVFEKAGLEYPEW